MRPPSSSAHAGFTLVELILAAALTSVIGLALGVVVFTSASSYERGAMDADLEERVSRTLERVSEELRFVDRELLDPALSAPFAASFATYQRVVGYADGVPVHGEPLRIALQLDPHEVDNGIDDDGDGLTDERRVVRIESPDLPEERTTVWCDDVSGLLEGELPNGLDDNGNGLVDEPGLCFELDGDTLVIRLTLERGAPGGRVEARTSETAIRLGS